MRCDAVAARRGMRKQGYRSARVREAEYTDHCTLHNGTRSLPHCTCHLIRELISRRGGHTQQPASSRTDRAFSTSLCDSPTQRRFEFLHNLFSLQKFQLLKILHGYKVMLHTIFIAYM